MIKKICPICDSELQNGNYCPLCRKVVRRPKAEERNYYLNERRPGSGIQGGVSLSPGYTEAAFGTASSAENPYYQKQAVGTNSGARGTSAGLPDYEGRKKTQPVYRPSQGKTRGRKTFTAGKAVLALFLFIVAVNLFIGFMSFATDTVLNDKNEVKLELEEPIWELGDSEEEEDNGYKVYELDPEQLREAGASCSFYSHANMDGESARVLTESFLSEYGAGEFKMVQDEYNMQYLYDDGSESTIYDTCLTYLHGEGMEESTGNEDFYSVSVGYDTGSGQLHYFQIDSGNIDFVVKAVEVFSEAVDQLDQSASMELEEIRDGVLALQDAAPQNFKDDFWFQGDDWSIYGYKESNGAYYISVECDGGGASFDSDIEISDIEIQEE